MNRDDRVLEDRAALRRARPARGLRRLLTALAAVAAILPAVCAQAQPLLVGNRFNFNFSNPGARSLAFGGAFAALADDATAAYANPAGLVQLTRPEVSVEWRRWDRSPSFIAGGRIEGDPTGEGLDTVEGLLFGRDESESIGPSFVSAVIPHSRWSFAAYGHRLARFEMTSESQGFFVEPEFAGDPFVRTPAVRERVDLEILTGGLSAAWRMNDRLRFGLGVAYSKVSLGTRTEFFFPDFRDTESVFQEIPFTPDRLNLASEVTIDDGDWTVQAGALWSLNDHYSAGVFYRLGAEAEGTNRMAAVFEDTEIESPGTATFAVPDVWGAGLAYRSPNGALTLAGEVDRVGYAGLLRSEIEGEEVEGREYRDAWEYHLGAEYALLKRRPILAFRLGAWVESNGDDILEERFTHLAIGLGIAADSFQIDLAADFSEEIDTGSVSFIYSF